MSVWALYVVFAILYSLWALRLSCSFSSDRRLGYLLCLTDVAVLLPLLVWSSGLGTQTVLIVVCAAGLAATYVADKSRGHSQSFGVAVSFAAKSHVSAASPVEARPETSLETAVRVRLQVLRATGARFGLVVLRIVRFDEATSLYGEDASSRILSAVGRRGLRLLGADAQRFTLPGGRVAFVFETEPSLGKVDDGDGLLAWRDPYDIEGLAMTLGRKVCEHLIEGHRVECVVGWASAPADGLTAGDLLAAAETGARSTAAFRRVSGSSVPARVVPTSGRPVSRIPAATPDGARSAVG